MREKEPPESINKTINLIVSYLLSNPNAKDTFQGVQRWWIENPQHLITREQFATSLGLVSFKKLDQGPTLKLFRDNL